VWKPRSAGDKVVKIASGTDHVVALCRNKKVLTWGSGQQGQLGRVGTRVGRRGHSLVDAYLSPAAMHLPFSMKGKPVDIAAGHYSSYVVFSTGEVISCGLNNYGQLGISADDTEPVRLCCWLCSMFVFASRSVLPLLCFCSVTYSASRAQRTPGLA
jgi:alpha-tubulin suppressor-like RCC1 family protein